MNYSGDQGNGYGIESILIFAVFYLFVDFNYVV